MPTDVTTRDRLITATSEVLRRRGYHGTGLKKVAEAAEATIGSLYHFFPQGKAQLVESAVLESGLAYRELFETIADGAGDPAAGIGEFFDGAAQVLAETDYIDVCPIGGVAREVASTDERLRMATDSVFMDWIEAVTARVAAAGMPAREARSLATTVIAALEGGFVLARARRDAGVLRGIGQQMRGLVTAGIAAHG